MVSTTRLKPFSFALFQGKLGALLGLLAGVLYSFGGFLIDSSVELGWMVSTETPGLSYGTVLAFGALVGMPIIFAAAGLVLGFIAALLFNVWSSWFGTIHTDFIE